MIKQLSIKLKNNNLSVRPCFDWGYQMYGYICDILNPSIVEEIHQTMHTPFSQFLINSNGKDELEWRISILDSSVDMMDGMLEIGNKIKLTKYNAELVITGKEISTISKRDFCKEYIIEGKSSRIKKVNILTPASFKSDGEYMIFPTSNLIINSALSKWNSVMGKYNIDDENAIGELMESCKIVGYKLKSIDYLLKGVKIPGFVGELTLKLSGNPRVMCLNSMLIDFLEFSGLGIKSALGMGACVVKR